MYGGGSRCAAPLLGHFLGFHHACLELSPGLDVAVFGFGGGTCVGGVLYCWAAYRLLVEWECPGTLGCPSPGLCPSGTRTALQGLPWKGPVRVVAVHCTRALHDQAFPEGRRVTFLSSVECAQGCQLSYTHCPVCQAGSSFVGSLTPFPSVGKPEGLHGWLAPLLLRRYSVGPWWSLHID